MRKTTYLYLRKLSNKVLKSTYELGRNSKNKINYMTHKSQFFNTPRIT